MTPTSAPSRQRRCSGPRSECVRTGSKPVSVSHLREQRLRVRALGAVDRREDDSPELVALRAVRVEPFRPWHRQVDDVESVQRVEELADVLLLVGERRAVDQAVDRDLGGVDELRHAHRQRGGERRQQLGLDGERL
jgi:hypothetical protein